MEKYVASYESFYSKSNRINPSAKRSARLDYIYSFEYNWVPDYPLGNSKILHKQLIQITKTPIESFFT